MEALRHGLLNIRKARDQVEKIRGMWCSREEPRTRKWLR